MLIPVIGRSVPLSYLKVWSSSIEFQVFKVIHVGQISRSYEAFVDFARSDIYPGSEWARFERFMIKILISYHMDKVKVLRLTFAV